MLATANFLVPNATVLVEIGVFAAVLGILARFVLPHLRAAMDRRQEEIRKSIETARRAEQLLAAAEVEYHAKLTDARRQARAIIDGGRSISDHLQTEARQRAREDHDRIVARAQWDIDRAFAVANDQLRQEAVRLGVKTRPSLDLVEPPSWR
jgi:F-type H+-transporting ATPase subunit b